MGSAFDHLSDAQCERFHREGYVIVERFFDPDEVQMLGRIARADHELTTQAASCRDGEGGVIRLAVRNKFGYDIYSAFVRCRPIVNTKESRHPRYEFLEKWPDERIKEIGACQLQQLLSRQNDAQTVG